MRDGWTGTTLGEVATLVIGRTPPRNENIYWTDDLTLPFCTIADMNGKWVEPSREGVTSEAIRDGKARKIEAGTLLMSFKLTIGRVGFAAKDLFPNEAIVAISPRESLVSGNYLYLVLGHQDLSEGSGRAVKGATLNSKSLAEIPLHLPPLEKQRRIIDLVASVDAYIAGLEKQVEAARTARNAVLQELLTAGGDDLAKTRLGNVVEFLRNRVDPLTLDPEQVLRHWSIPALDETGGPLDEKAREIGSHKFQVRENAVVFSLLNPRIPRFALVVGGDNVVCSTEFAVMKPGPRMLEEFLLVVASSAIFHKKVDSLANGTTKSRERVKVSDLENSVIFLPSLDEQKRIVEIVSSMDDLIQSTERAVVNAKSLRAGLLSDLLSGEHEIPESYDGFLAAA